MVLVGQGQRSLLLKPMTVWILAVLCWLPMTSFASTSELKGVSSEISRQKQNLSSQQKKLDELQQSLKQQELSITRLEKEITETKAQQKKTQESIADLQRQIDQLEAQKKAQSDKLAELIQTYYMTERAKAPANMLNRGVEEDRISQYFQHLAKQRADIIDELQLTTEKLTSSQRQLELEQAQIAALLKQQTEQKNALTKTQSSRKGTVANIKKSISNDQVYLSELQRNETRLKAEIAKAAKRNAVPMDGIARQKGKLPWPLKGRILHRYGAPQTGQLSWKGWVIDADYGQSVKAVYSGTVVFADYLRGYGLVVLLDHGKGDMTLYGFNQSLMKKEGDKVTAGETIALAGDTGGQPQASLYFEIRRNSKTQDPSQWLTR